MLKIYGSMLCKDCIECREALDAANIPYEFLDFSEHLQNLKEFLRIRDSHPLYKSVLDAGIIGIPCMVRPDGSITLSWDEYVSQDRA